MLQTDRVNNEILDEMWWVDSYGEPTHPVESQHLMHPPLDTLVGKEFNCFDGPQ